MTKILLKTMECGNFSHEREPSFREFPTCLLCVVHKIVMDAKMSCYISSIYVRKL